MQLAQSIHHPAVHQLGLVACPKGDDIGIAEGVGRILTLVGHCDEACDHFA